MKASKPEKSENLFPVVGVGASAGGLQAFRQLLKAIPEDSGMAYVLIQHLDPSHESILPELLQKVTAIPVLEIADSIRVKPNHIYVLPGNKMMVANDGILELMPRPEVRKGVRNLPIDLFFKSLAEVHSTHAIGIVLSGNASDGTEGLKAIKEHGGLTFAQDEASASNTGMPVSAVKAGVVDFVLSPEEIPLKILELHKETKEAHTEVYQPAQDEEVFKQIISVLRIRKGTDFTFYKQTTIRRRILRRMEMHRKSEPAVYLKLLKSDIQEQDELYQDLLIPVTAFFRDEKNFEDLCKNIIPAIAEDKTSRETIRIWVAGCSTGQEAYTIAICFREFLGDNHRNIQIFATDISEPAIAKARTGLYTKSEMAGMSPAHMEQYFTLMNGHYRVNTDVRDMCVFAIHNFLKDPPFGKLDLISCRNVLIYMEAYLQKKALTTFHYSLNPKAFLFLGKTETTASVPDLFSTVGKNNRLFVRKDVSGRFMHVASQRSEQNFIQAGGSARNEAPRADYNKTADDIVLSRYSPAGVTVNEALDIVHFRGSTGDFLEQLPGKPSHNLLKLAKPGLSFELRSLLHKARKEKITIKKEAIPLQINGSLHTICIEVIPLPNTIESHYLVLFHLETSVRSSEVDEHGNQDFLRGKDLRILQLEQEIVQIHEDMRIITEEQEATNEELQNDNQDLLSSSEELQSLNEELETSKEELQSTNEELTVVNQEIVGLNELVTEARDYAEAIVGTVREPLLVLDKHLRVKTANSSYYKAFLVNEQETEGKLIYEVDNRQWDIPGLRTLLEKILPEESTFMDFEISHTFRHLGERTMLLNARELVKEGGAEKLILLAIEDVTEQRKAEAIRKQIQKRFQFIADAMPQKVWTADANGIPDYFNKIWIDYTGMSFEELRTSGWEGIIHQDDAVKNSEQWQHSILTGEDFELEERFLNDKKEYQWHLTRGLSYKDENGKIAMWVGTNTEIQGQRKEKEELEKAVARRTQDLQEASSILAEKNGELLKINKELQSFAYVSSHDLQEPLRKIQTFANRILEKEHDSLSDTAKDYFRRMQAAANRMQQLIEDLLAYSRVNTAERKLEDTDVLLLLEEVKMDLKEALDEQKAVIHTSDLGRAMIVPFQFRQLFHNLITNALKFSDPLVNAEITIAGSFVKGKELLKEKLITEEDNSVKKNYYRISITDNGIGFDPRFGERIFEVFQKLHPKEEYAGTGIGLAIVKKIVENHNGFITAQGDLGKGATFTIYIPA